MQSNLRTRHSDFDTCGPKERPLNLARKSDSTFPTYDTLDAALFLKTKEDVKVDKSALGDETSDSEKLSGKCEKYYKKYELDEFPVKDVSVNSSKAAVSCLGHGDAKTLLNAQSDLDGAEKSIHKNVSQQLQTEDGSLCSLESNIKFFKTTVQEILDNFFTSVQDFEVYKKRFHEILEKSHEDSVMEMEEFIKDMIHHVMTSEPSVSGKKSLEHTATDALSNNDNYNLDSSNVGSNVSPCEDRDKATLQLLFDDNSSSRSNRYRNLFSEVHLQYALECRDKKVVSLDNFNRINPKKLQLDRCMLDDKQTKMSEKDIPVKVSSAKRDMHKAEEEMATEDLSACTKSFMSRLCAYFCKKLRRC
ncbi:hypothetical protein JYU34_003118 [Plutella xylostella]|uniref:Uncharacterized protein n=1 Tax=Plutella xylostella TaxID=51655 RepID=A0ABQ7QZ67_PLUXY|nr:hypothetical protein JYU34_003118 [Plutella xylostella]